MITYSDRVKHFNEYHRDEMYCIHCGAELKLLQPCECERRLTMKFKVGDRVKVKCIPDDPAQAEVFVIPMNNCLNEEFNIIYCYDNLQDRDFCAYVLAGSGRVAHPEFDDNAVLIDYEFPEDALELVK